MKKIILITFLNFIQTINLLSEPKLQEVISGLESPWSLSFIKDNRVLVTEKSGNLLLVDFDSKKKIKIKQN